VCYKLVATRGKAKQEGKNGAPKRAFCLENRRKKTRKSRRTRERGKSMAGDEKWVKNHNPSPRGQLRRNSTIGFHTQKMAGEKGKVYRSSKVQKQKAQLGQVYHPLETERRFPLKSSTSRKREVSDARTRHGGSRKEGRQ